MEKIPNWDNMDDTALSYTQRRRRSSDDNDVVYHVDGTGEDDNRYYPFQKISPSNQAFMMTLSFLNNSTESHVTSNTVVEELTDDGPVKTVVPPSPIKVTTEYESGDDDLVEQVCADRTARELAAVNAAKVFRYCTGATPRYP